MYASTMGTLISRGVFTASNTAVFVISLNVTRFTSKSARNNRFSLSISNKCHDIASPSRSGSVASNSTSTPFKASVISFNAARCLDVDVHVIANDSSGRTLPRLFTKSLTCP